MKREMIFITIKVDLESNLKHISDTVHEVESKADFHISGLQNINILETEILITRVRNPKKTTDHGTQP